MGAATASVEQGRGDMHALSQCGHEGDKLGASQINEELARETTQGTSTRLGLLYKKYKK